MATVVTRTTGSGARRRYVVFHATDRVTGKRRKVWELVPSGLMDDANGRKAEVEVALRQSGHLWPPEELQPEVTDATIESHGVLWLERHRRHLRDRVYANYKASLENHVYPAIGARRLVDVGPADLKALRDAMRAKKVRDGKALSDDTIKAALVPLRSLVRDWAEDAKRPDPIAGLRLFGKGSSGEGRARRSIKPPEPEHITALADSARTEARDAILVAAATGLRRGELFGLRWRDIDFASNEIHVSAYNFAGRVEEGRFKTEAGERDVPLFKSIRTLLVDRKARMLEKGRSRPEDFVFATTVGTPIDPNNFVKRELKAAVKSANEARAKKELPPLPAFRWHDFRHYAVSMLIAQKADILTLARIAGHADPNVTLRVYGHLMKGALSEAAERFEPLAQLAAVQGA